jgi:hypothetical protein
MSVIPRRLPRRAAVATLAALLASTLAVTADGSAVAASTVASPTAKTTAAARAAAAARWLDSQVVRGRIHNGQFDFDDWGLTIDTAFALAASGGHRATLRQMTSAIQHHYFRSYATSGGDKFAGPLAKALLAATVLGKNPRTFGGHNVRALVLSLVAPRSAGFEAGRVRDRTADHSDFSSTFAQAYAVIGLARSGGVPTSTVKYLLKQQCSGGYFRLTEVAGETCDESGSAADVDATALAVQALRVASSHGLAIPAGVVHRAASWLVRIQRENGSFRGGTSTPGPNANSTGLAAQALNLVPGHRAQVRKAARYIRSLQVTRKRAHGRATRDIGAIAYNRAGLKNGLKNGIQKIERDQFRRASAQAIFALAPRPLTTLRVR